jgi:hypothetical protein
MRIAQVDVSRIDELELALSFAEAEINSKEIGDTGICPRDLVMVGAEPNLIEPCDMVTKTNIPEFTKLKMAQNQELISRIKDFYNKKYEKHESSVAANLFSVGTLVRVKRNKLTKEVKKNRFVYTDDVFRVLERNVHTSTYKLELVDDRKVQPTRILISHKRLKKVLRRPQKLVFDPEALSPGRVVDEPETSEEVVQEDKPTEDSGLRRSSRNRTKTVRFQL